MRVSISASKSRSLMNIQKTFSEALERNPRAKKDIINLVSGSPVEYMRTLKASPVLGQVISSVIEEFYKGMKEEDDDGTSGITVSAPMDPTKENKDYMDRLEFPLTKFNVAWRIFVGPNRDTKQ